MNNVYAAFSDESRHTASRFRSIATVSMYANHVIGTQKELNEILKESNVTEFKWNKVKSARLRFCAIKLIDFVIDNLILNGGRIDVVIWDVEDSRHTVFGRDDIKNLERMYFHLHKNTMMRRKPDADWHLRPDEQSAIDWYTIHDCLGSAGYWKQYLESIFPDSIIPKRLYSVKSLKEVKSEQYPLCQLADMFAGMSTYARLKSKTMKYLITKKSNQNQLFEVIDSSSEPSKSDRVKYRVISHLYRKCKQRSLGVSFATKGYLQTYNPDNPINFWHYDPQHPKDKAPTRSTWLFRKN